MQQSTNRAGAWPLRGRCDAEEAGDGDDKWVHSVSGGAGDALAGAGPRAGRAGPRRGLLAREGKGRRWAGQVWVWAERGEKAAGLVLGFWVGLGVFYFPFLFLIQTSLFEFKQNLNSTLTLKQINQCSSMNATTQLNLRKFLIT